MKLSAYQRRRFVANAALACVLLIFAALWLDPPTRTGFWPACPIHEYLGIECPGCGATRALAALLHGHLLEALRLNALFVVLLPAGVVAAIRTYIAALRSTDWHWPQLSNAALCSTLAAAAVFTIVRNVIH